MRSLISIVIVCFLLGTSMLYAGTVYKKVNKDGSVEYSDVPFTGASEVKLKDIDQQNTLPAFKRPPSLTNKPTRKSSAAKPDVHIVSPLNGDTLRDNEGNITIVVQKEGKEKKKYKTQILINGAPVGKPTQASVISIKNISRGEIKIKAQLLSRTGKILATTPETVVYMHRVSVIRSN